MRLFIYKNNFCDPERNIGVARQLPSAKEVDMYVEGFLRSATRKSIMLGQWRMFVTNDDVEFAEVDHHVLMDEPYKLGLGADRIKELDVRAAWLDLNSEGGGAT